jgi:hypothetical protein
VMKIIETPKGNDDNKLDRKMLRRLRAYGRTPARSGRLPTRRGVPILSDSAASAPPR